MKIFWQLVSIGLAIALIVLLVWALLPVRPEPMVMMMSITVEQLNNEIRAKLPLGSSRSEVDAFIVANHFVRDGGSYSGSKSDSQADRTESATTAVTSDEDRYSIYMVFRFDSDGRLIQYFLEANRHVILS